MYTEKFTITFKMEEVKKIKKEDRIYYNVPKEEFTTFKFLVAQYCGVAGFNTITKKWWSSVKVPTYEEIK